MVLLSLIDIMLILLEMGWNVGACQSGSVAIAHVLVNFDGQVRRVLNFTMQSLMMQHSSLLGHWPKLKYIY